jgi:hypothetical protein
MKSIILGGYGNQLCLWGLGRWMQNGAIELIIEVFIYSICLGYGHLDVILISQFFFVGTMSFNQI